MSEFNFGQTCFMHIAVACPEHLFPPTLAMSKEKKHKEEKDIRKTEGAIKKKKRDKGAEKSAKKHKKHKDKKHKHKKDKKRDRKHEHVSQYFGLTLVTL